MNARAAGLDRARVLMTAGALLAAMVTVAHAGTTTGPKVTATAVVARSLAPPPAHASTTTMAGRNHVAIRRSHDAGIWVEQIDIDGEGTVDNASFVWDEPNKILFASKSGRFRCKTGGSGSGDMLVAVNAAANPRHRPAGSGFWVADVGDGMCGAQFAGVFGCRFDGNGIDTRCGLVRIDSQTDDILIVTAAK